jgi:hypothetical protein
MFAISPSLMRAAEIFVVNTPLPLVAAQNRRSTFTATYGATTKGSGWLLAFFGILLVLKAVKGAFTGEFSIVRIATRSSTR